MTDRQHSLRSWLRQIRRVRNQRQDTRRRAKQEGYLVVLGIMKNEALILQEWIDHYLWQGADKIILIDNGSSDNSMDIAQANERGGRVTCISRPQKHRQEDHYRDAIRASDLRKKYEWLLIADLDEFWFCKDGSLVRQALMEVDGLNPGDYTLVDLIYLDSTEFGSSGFVQQPNSTRESFIMRNPNPNDLDIVFRRKWIYRISKLKHVKDITIHNVLRIRSDKVISGHRKFQLNHYRIQSREYFEKIKMTRGDSNIPGFIRDWAYFAEQDANCSIEDRLLATQVKGLRT